MFCLHYPITSSSIITTTAIASSNSMESTTEASNIDTSSSYSSSSSSSSISAVEPDNKKCKRKCINNNEWRQCYSLSSFPTLEKASNYQQYQQQYHHKSHPYSRLHDSKYQGRDFIDAFYPNKIHNRSSEIETRVMYHNTNTNRDTNMNTPSNVDSCRCSQRSNYHQMNHSTPDMRHHLNCKHPSSSLLFDDTKPNKTSLPSSFVLIYRISSHLQKLIVEKNPAPSHDETRDSTMKLANTVIALVKKIEQYLLDANCDILIDLETKMEIGEVILLTTLLYLERLPEGTLTKRNILPAIIITMGLSMKIIFDHHPTNARMVRMTSFCDLKKYNAVEARICSLMNFNFSISNEMISRNKMRFMKV